MALVKAFAATLLKGAHRSAVKALVGAAPERRIHHLSLNNINPTDLDDKFERFFNRCDIDGWDIRQGMNDLAGMDAVPEPRICIAALYACRRVNDLALAIRFLEMVRNKCGPNVPEIWPYIVQEIAPVLCELGVDTPEALGYHKPELWFESDNYIS